MAVLNAVQKVIAKIQSPLARLGNRIPGVRAVPGLTIGGDASRFGKASIRGPALVVGLVLAGLAGLVSLPFVPQVM